MSLLVFAVFGALFVLVAVVIARAFPVGDPEDFLVAGRSLPFGIISASVMISWIWTTTLLGAAEAGYLFGIGGGFAFAIGSVVPFFVFIPLALRLRRLMPYGTTFLEFVRERYGVGLQRGLLVLTILLALYISGEQIIGISYALSASYQIPYAAVAMISTLIVVLYLTIAGLRGSVLNDVIQFFVIAIVVFVLLPVVATNIGIGNIYEGLAQVAGNPDNELYNPDALTLLAPAAIRYCLIALVISMGFVLLNQGYYSKARAAISSKSLLAAYLLGTVIAWAPVPILFGVVLGGGGLAQGMTTGEELRVTTDVASAVFTQALPTGGALAFSLMVFMAGMTTAGNALAGFQALVTVDLRRSLPAGRWLLSSPTRFARLSTLVFGVVVAIFAIVLQGASLLYIDILSGIIFSTPIAALVLGLLWRRPSTPVAAVSIVLGLLGGIGTYLAVDDPNLDYFYGNVVSLGLPFLVVVVGTVLSKRDYDFDELKEYRSPTAEARSGPDPDAEGL
ncbi:sodium:solute symporter family transporter [Qaidamihabitans albus]|uniref:sodium:solute symporter family transporter n=1 Tax=Qaidamihabitans albus TaxID=2795733 RepID=UPI0018F268BF|nr:hypothetical protein [Qaidamihabitans albus]